jgi:hypothetical protein
MFPAWFFHPVTERQLQWIRSEGLVVPVASGALTKGQASDIIGLFEPIDEHDEEVLRFFKVPTRGMNQSRGRHEAAVLLADSAKTRVWEARPADSMQRECLRFFGAKAPKELTHAEAQRLIGARREELSEKKSALLDDWDSFESIVVDLDDRETRDEYDMKKPSMAMIRTAVDVLRKEGHTMDDLAGDLTLVAEKLLQLKPELGR